MSNRGGPASNGGQGSMLAQPLRPPSAGRAAAHLGLFVLGAVAGLAGTLVQAAWFPGGLLLALAGAAGLFLGGSYATAGRSGAVAPVAGWIVTVILLISARPEGDFLFAAGAGSYLFLFGGMALAVICATVGVGRQPRVGSARLGK
ncbi:hypothetical protein JK359_26935 [Streptomyces actinomycinicus]|uniref:Integral membrane protein n=1 Tax=Streptomyces actinomycinicus TaxID=1695166 RepID=A0A937EPA5_9ACTN|nr:DUF6113 family protein [Streptomyces actinomycinicus]MBL1085559.1 hypothetical protein [Streptomyces actinomycinicus]